LRENDLIKDIESLESNAKIIDVMRKEEIDKIDNVIDGM